MGFQVIKTNTLLFGEVADTVTYIIRWIGLQIAMLHIQYLIKPAGNMKAQSIHVYGIISAVFTVIQPAFVREGIFQFITIVFVLRRRNYRQHITYIYLCQM